MVEFEPNSDAAAFAPVISALQRRLSHGGGEFAAAEANATGRQKSSVNVSKKAKHTREFRGKTEWDIEAQFSRWQQANAGLMLSIKRHPIERLPLPVQRPGFEHRPVKIADTFSMRVEYETRDHDRQLRKRGK
jgi:hypothetical protein